MIQAGHTKFFVHFFNIYTRYMLKWHFTDVNITGDTHTPQNAILLIGNHISWWDGFWALHINNSCWNKRFHVMMLEEELKPRMFLNKAGAYSIRKHSRDVINSLRYTQQLLHNPDNLVVMYPQGEILSSYHYPVVFEQGIWRIIQNIPENAHIFFYVALTDYFSSVKPYLRFYLKEADKQRLTSKNDLENMFNAHLQDSIYKQTTEY